ncbi:MAG: nuclear transport factor 2 family protein [Saprospiraceae bacterium]|nr:nuclear transport factor 2 family protein [Saprospiraceae bacterium]MBP7642880.1 nuclear transport factor 2 family protein [Saprospiraceae bacterium]
MKSFIITAAALFTILQFSFAQTTAEQEIMQLSRDKWQWMADKDVAKLENLFDEKARFVHMSGTWKTPRELEIIKTGSIWYKEAKIKDVAVDISDNTAVVWNRIILVAQVRGSDVTTEFTVTEVYQKKESSWKMLALTFSSVRDTHELEK